MQTVKMHATLKKLLNLMLRLIRMTTIINNVDDCKEDYYNKDDIDDGSCHDDDDVDVNVNVNVAIEKTNIHVLFT